MFVEFVFLCTVVYVLIKLFRDTDVDEQRAQKKICCADCENIFDIVLYHTEEKYERTIGANCPACKNKNIIKISAEGKITDTISYSKELEKLKTEDGRKLAFEKEKEAIAARKAKNLALTKTKIEKLDDSLNKKIKENLKSA